MVKFWITFSRVNGQDKIIKLDSVLVYPEIPEKLLSRVLGSVE